MCGTGKRAASSFPVIRFSVLTESLDIAATRVEMPEEIVLTFEKLPVYSVASLSALVIAEEVPSAKVGDECGQE